MPEPTSRRGRWVAIVTGALSILIGVLYLGLILVLDSRGPLLRTSSSSRIACGEPPVTRDPRKYKERNVSGPQIPSG